MDVVARRDVVSERFWRTLARFFSVGDLEKPVKFNVLTENHPMNGIERPTN